MITRQQLQAILNKIYKTGLGLDIKNMLKEILTDVFSQVDEQIEEIPIGGGVENVATDPSIIVGVGAAADATNVTAGSVLIGQDAARNSNLGNFNSNIAIGKNAAKDFSGAGGAFYITALGEEALEASAQSSCVAAGWQSLKGSSGTSTTAVGIQTGKDCFASSSTFIGRNAGQGSGKSGDILSSVVYIGDKAGKGAGSTGKVSTSKSVAIGQFAGESSGGAGGVYIGKSAGSFTEAVNVIGIGEGAARSSTGDNTVAIGLDAGLLNSIAGQFIVRNSSMPEYADRATAVAAITVENGARADNTYMYYNTATNAIEAVRL